MTVARYDDTATLLPNGRVLIAGGDSFSVAWASAELYNSATGTFSPTGTMIAPRQSHTATLLTNGQVLIAGGADGNSLVEPVAELYDPATGAFSATGSLTTPLVLPLATLLPDGQVLVAGGFNNTGLLARAELYDPGLAAAPVTYTYTGNGFISFHNDGCPTPACNITGKFTVPYPLVGLTNAVVSPESFSFTDGITVWTNNNASPTAFTLSTNANGDITAWNIFLTIPTAFTSSTILFTNSYDACCASGHDAAFTILSSDSGNYYGESNLDNPGTWARTPSLAAPPPAPTINSGPADPTNQTSAAFAFSDTQAGVTFVCSLDGSTFAVCTSGQTYTGVPQGSHSVSVEAKDNSANLSAPTSFAWTIDTTPPTISGSATPPANSYGWNNTSVTVGFTCSDALSVISSCSSPTTLTGEGVGQSVTGTATDNAGNTAQTTVTVNIDKTNPTVTYTGNAGTYTVDQTVAITCAAADGLSGVDTTTCANINGTAYSFGLGIHNYSAAATDKAGNVGNGSTSFTVIDTTPPTISGSATPPANGYGWNNTNVTISFTCSDPLSGIASCSAPTTLTGEGAGQSVTGTAKDNAGNTAQTTVTVNIDKTNPTVTYTGNAGTYTVDQTVAITCAAADGLSGVATTTCANINGTAHSFGLGTHSYSAAATDKAGNVGNGSTSFTVIDTTPPTISGSATPPANGYGWNNTSVTVGFTCSDALSVISSCSSPTTLTGEGAGQSVTGTAKDNAGNTAQTKVSVNIDKTNPTVTYTGNTGSYTVDQTVAITCAAADGLSGVATTTCANINGTAYSFGLGTHSYSAAATDKAGNAGNGSASFTVQVTPASLGNLVTQFVGNPGIASALVSKLSAAQAAAARGDVNALYGQLGAFINQVSAQSGKSLSAAQAAILIQMATALML